MKIETERKGNFFFFLFFVCVSLRLTEKKPKNNLKTAKLFHRMRNETNFHFHAAHTQILFFFCFWLHAHLKIGKEKLDECSAVFEYSHCSLTFWMSLSSINRNNFFYCWLFYVHLGIAWFLWGWFGLIYWIICVYAELLSFLLDLLTIYSFYREYPI